MAQSISEFHLSLLFLVLFFAALSDWLLQFLGGGDPPIFFNQFSSAALETGFLRAVGDFL